MTIFSINEDDLEKFIKEFQSEYLKNFGGREDININLAGVLKNSDGFNSLIKSIRGEVFKIHKKEEFDKIIEKLRETGEDTLIDFGDFMFRDIFISKEEYVDMPENLVPTPINDYVNYVLDKYNLAPNFYAWVFYYIDTGTTPGFVPLFDGHILDRNEMYLSQNSGLTSSEKRNLIAFFRETFINTKLEKFYSIKKLINSLPNNKFRRKKFVDDVKEYKEKISTENLNATKIALEIIDNNNIDLPLELEGKLTKNISSKLRKRNNRYNK